jgi:hypothetical protein
MTGETTRMILVFIEHPLHQLLIHLFQIIPHLQLVLIHLHLRNSLQNLSMNFLLLPLVLLHVVSTMVKQQSISLQENGGKLSPLIESLLQLFQAMTRTAAMMNYSCSQEVFSLLHMKAIQQVLHFKQQTLQQCSQLKLLFTLAILALITRRCDEKMLIFGKKLQSPR